MTNSKHTFSYISKISVFCEAFLAVCFRTDYLLFKTSYENSTNVSSAYHGRETELDFGQNRSGVLQLREPKGSNSDIEFDPVQHLLSSGGAWNKKAPYNQLNITILNYNPPPLNSEPNNLRSSCGLSFDCYLYGDEKRHGMSINSFSAVIMLHYGIERFARDWSELENEVRNPEQIWVILFIHNSINGIHTNSLG